MKITPSPLLANMSGTSGHLTIQTKYGRPFVRTNLPRPDAQSAEQLAVRAAFRNVGSLWFSLTNYEADLWRAVPDHLPLTGNNRHFTINMPLELAATETIPLPFNPDVPAPDNWRWKSDFDPGGIRAEWDAVLHDGFTMIYAIARQVGTNLYTLRRIETFWNWEHHNFRTDINGSTWQLTGAYYNPTTTEVGTTAVFTHTHVPA